MTNPKGGNGGGEGEARSFGVDYVIHYKVPENERAEAEASYVQLIEALASVGLASEVRPADDSSLLVFVKMASEDRLREQAYHARLQDWLHGVRTAGAGASGDLAAALMEEPVSEAERLRLVYLAMVKTKEDGGAGITPGAGKWKYADSVFPLHDRAFNGEWIKRLSTQYLLARGDLDEIRDKFGEGVALYFAFIQSYFRALVFPAALGAGTWLLLGGGQFSFVYALGSCLWCVVFFEYWKTKEVDLAVQWGVRGVSKIQMPRVEFVGEGVAEDPVTGEKRGVYSPLKRLGTQLLQVPFTVACVVVLGGFIAMCNSLEVFINEVYTGPFKTFLPFLPTILQVVSLPAFSSVLTGFARKLTDMENYETVDAHHAAMVQKEFVLNFITSYMPLAFTAFVYLPFGHLLTPYLDFWRVAAEKVTFGQKQISMKEFNIDPGRITKQMFYFTVTAQIVNFGTEAVVPYVKRKLTNKVKERGIVGKAAKPIEDAEEEAGFLAKVRAETELEVYDVTTDYREMVIQFDLACFFTHVLYEFPHWANHSAVFFRFRAGSGYLSLFSVAWPLAGCGFLVNNWVELRSDAFKIATGSRRPIPWRADSIGPWLDALGFLSWLGSLTSAAIVTLCRGETRGSSGAASGVQAWGVLLAVLLAEHFYLAVQMGVRAVMGKMDSPGLQRERRERFAMRRRMLGDGAGEKLAREGLLHGEAGSGDQQTPARSDRFWRRHEGVAGTIEAGRALISRVQGAS